MPLDLGCVSAFSLVFQSGFIHSLVGMLLES
jgi:hypothetical protein